MHSKFRVSSCMRLQRHCVCARVRVDVLACLLTCWRACMHVAGRRARGARRAGGCVCAHVVACLVMAGVLVWVCVVACRGRVCVRRACEHACMMHGRVGVRRCVPCVRVCAMHACMVACLMCGCAGVRAPSIRGCAVVQAREFDMCACMRECGRACAKRACVQGCAGVPAPCVRA